MDTAGGLTHLCVTDQSKYYWWLGTHTPQLLWSAYLFLVFMSCGNAGYFIVGRRIAAGVHFQVWHQLQALKLKKELAVGRWGCVLVKQTVIYIISNVVYSKRNLYQTFHTLLCIVQIFRRSNKCCRPWSHWGNPHKTTWQISCQHF